MKTTKEYLESLDEVTATAIKVAMVNKVLGIKADAPGCTPDNCSGTTGCTPTTANGECSCINGVCTWVPSIG